MNIAFTYSPFWIIPITILAAGLTWIMYRRTRDQIPLVPRGIVALFRWIVLSVLGILLLEPILQSMTKLVFPPIIVVLQDVSQSIRMQKDSSFMRNQYPEKLKNFMEQFPSDSFKMEGYRFDNELYTGLKTDSLRYKGDGTNIAEALSQIQSIYENQNLGGIVVLSDGITTSGKSPVYALEGFKQPVFSVLLGDTTLQKDIKIKDVVFNELAYFNTDIPIKVKVQDDGYDAAELKVTLVQDGNVLDTKPLSLGKNKTNGEVDFVVRPKKVGLQQFTVNVSQMPEEITYRNNTRVISINVIETRLKVALFAAAPHPDLGALTEVLKHEEGYQIEEFILKNKAGEYYNVPAAQNFSNYDIFVLHNFPNSAADAATVNKIAEAIKTNNKPLICFVGQFTDLQTMRPLYDYMALTPSAINPKSEEVVAVFSDNYKKHSTFTFGDNWLNWINTAPPIYRNKSEWAPKATAEVFATAKVKNIPMGYPVFALQSHLGRKNMVFLGENFWRMRMHSFTENDNFDGFDDWVFNTMKWLMAQDDKRKFKVYATKTAYNGNEPVILKGEGYDDSYNPIPGMEIKVAIKFPNGKVNDYFLTETGQARYALEIFGLQEGTYSFTATGKKGDKEIGTDAGQFSVGRNDIEHVNLRADKEVMQQMALRTNGEFSFVNELDKLAAKIKKNENMKPIVDYKKQKKSIMDWWQILAALLVLLSGEWIIRKWYSML
jgi:hypothetical protein